MNNNFAKIAIDALPAMMMASLRFVIVIAVLFAFLKPPPANWRLFFLSAPTLGISTLAFESGHVEAARAAH